MWQVFFHLLVTSTMRTQYKMYKYIVECDIKHPYPISHLSNDLGCGMMCKYLDEVQLPRLLDPVISSLILDWFSCNSITLFLIFVFCKKKIFFSFIQKLIIFNIKLYLFLTSLIATETVNLLNFILCFKRRSLKLVFVKEWLVLLILHWNWKLKTKHDLPWSIIFWKDIYYKSKSETPQNCYMYIRCHVWTIEISLLEPPIDNLNVSQDFLFFTFFSQSVVI